METSKNGRSGCLENKGLSYQNDPTKESEPLESEESYQELLNNCCLPETILNKYMDLINKLSPSTLYAFNTHFFTAFSDHGYSRIHRWTKNIDIFSKERLFIPVYFKTNRMWSLISVNFRDKSIRFYDSVGTRGIRYQKLILKYLKTEYFMRKRKFFCATHWKYINLNHLHNGFKFWDSGLFMCLVAYHFALNASNDAILLFSSKYVGSQEKIKRELLTQIKRNSIPLINQI